MQHIRYINEFNSADELNENGLADKAIGLLSKAGKHATLAIIQYLNENPEVLTDVFDALGDKKK